MELKTGWTFLGSLLGLGGAAGLYFGLGVGWIALGVVAGVVLIGYIVAAVAAAPRDRTTGFGEFMRGLLIGFNAGLNGFLAFFIVAALAGQPAGLGVGIGLGVFQYLSVFGPISQNGFYQGMLGWLTWFMPMSWPIVGFGFTFLLFSAFLWAITGGQVRYLRVESLRVEWKTGTIFIKGGLVANLNTLDTAFNMGNFSFVDYKSTAWHMEHEAGHTLNLAAFGAIFHVLGAFDENATGRGAHAFSERMAESNSTGKDDDNIPMWA